MKSFKTMMTAAFVLLATCAGMAQSSANQNVTVTVSVIDAISTSGGDISMTISSATPGSEPDNATDVGTWAITTNQSNRKVTGQLDELYASGVELQLNLAGCTGCTSAGSVQLIAASATDLVTGITTLAESGLARTYTAIATASDGSSAAELQVVTLTVAAG